MSELILDTAFVNFLSKVTQVDDWEQEFLNLLSQLEFVGCRKIIKSQPFDQVTAAMLKHLSEEAQHAYLIKEAALKINDKEQSWAQGRFTAAGWEYFQGLDQKISGLSEDRSLAYERVSWAIERRVLQVYPLYVKMTQWPHVKGTLELVLSQEKDHGRIFSGAHWSTELKNEMKAIEETHWHALVSSICLAVAH